MKKFSLGLEVIDFQKDDIFEQVAMRFKAIKDSKWKNLEITKELDRIIFDRFGLKTKLELHTDQGGHAMLPVYVNPMHVFLDDRTRKMITLLRKIRSQEVEPYFDAVVNFKKITTVDLKRAKVTGALSELEVAIGMGSSKPYTLLSEHELAAIYLHEIGHVFTFFEMAIRVTTTNLVLLGLCSIAQSVDKQKKEFIIKKAENILEIPENSLVLINETTDEKVVATVFLDKILRLQKSSSGSNYYDYVAREQVADQFVSRLGGGRHLITGLDILIKYDGTGKTYKYYMPIIIRMVFQFGLLYFNAFAGLLLALYFIKELDETDPHIYHTYGYDNDKVRFQRIKNDMSLKLRENISDDEKKLLLDSIEKLDTLIKETEVLSTLLSKVARFINLPTMKKKQEMYNLHRDLEDIAFNDLFIKSEKLRLV